MLTLVCHLLVLYLLSQLSPIGGVYPSRAAGPGLLSALTYLSPLARMHCHRQLGSAQYIETELKYKKRNIDWFIDPAI